jgi:hypothetical protein
MNITRAILRPKDLALELPTGTGKTLVGLLIGEFRRRARNERVAFLCSTKQLCAQAHKQAKKYGIPTSLLVGRQADYDSGDFFNYQQGKALAVTTYSGVFNNNPKISDPHTIVCDDAHAAENFVPDMWTLTVNRDEHPKLFARLYSLLRGVMSENAAYRIEADANPSYSAVEMISPIALDDLRRQFAETVTAFLSEYESLSYPWSLISQHLPICNLYCSSYSFEVRPVLSPTLTHAPFAGATQRIYMSATLGDDGDLERCFGVKKITRLPAPEGWDKRGTGRRLVLFPELSSKAENEGLDVLEGLLKEVKRSLILVPNNRLRDVFNEALKDLVTVFIGADTEEKIERFRSHPGPAALILANRYDGIDFPGEECRNDVVYGFPLGADLQETFLTQRLKAFAITQDRVRTRVTQAMGRCTRDESDYAIVLILGADLVKWFCTEENVRGMHPELQAEIAFGLENSTDGDTTRFLELAKAFLARSNEWDGAENYIKSERTKKVKAADESVLALQKAAEAEIDFTYASWNGLYEKSYLHADNVLVSLSGGSSLRAYRCFWQHQAAVAAYRAWKETSEENYRTIVADRLNEAAKGNYGIAWLSGLAAKLDGKTAEEQKTMATAEWYSIIEHLLGELGLFGSKFDRMLAQQSTFIQSTDAKKFHQALNFLGKMLGAVTHEWTGNAKPDGFWNLGYWRAFVFEAKTAEFVEGAVTMSTVRQALTHANCVRVDKLLPAHTALDTVVVSRRTTIDVEAQKHAGALLHCPQSALINLFTDAASALTELRVLAPTASQEELPEKAIEIYKKHNASPQAVVSILTQQKLAEMALPVAAKSQ